MKSLVIFFIFALWTITHTIEVRSPFAEHVYQLLITNNLFDKVYHDSDSGEEAQTNFYTCFRYFAEHFGASIPTDKADEVFHVAEGNFDGKMTKYNNFKANTAVVESFLLHKGLLTQENYRQLADLYYRSIKKSYDFVSGTKHPLIYMYSDFLGDVYFYESIGKLSEADVVYILDHYLEEALKIKNS